MNGTDIFMRIGDQLINISNIDFVGVNTHKETGEPVLGIFMAGQESQDTPFLIFEGEQGTRIWNALVPFSAIEVEVVKEEED